MFNKKKNKPIDPFKNQPKGTQAIVHIEDIKIPPSFAASEPRPYKFGRYIRLYNRLGHFDKPITVIPETNEYGYPNKLILVDGLVRYYIAKKFNLPYVPVIYQDINTYKK